MKTRYLLCDLDGTITRIDVLDLIIKQFHADCRCNHAKVNSDTLIERINQILDVPPNSIVKFLSDNIDSILKKNYNLFIQYIEGMNIRLVLMSGNIDIVVSFFASIFNAHYYFSTSLCNKVISKGITVNKKIHIVEKYLIESDILSDNLCVIGNDLSDIPFWELSKKNSVYFGNKQNDTFNTTYKIYSEDFIELIDVLNTIWT